MVEHNTWQTTMLKPTAIRGLQAGKQRPQGRRFLELTVPEFCMHFPCYAFYIPNPCQSSWFNLKWDQRAIVTMEFSCPVAYDRHQSSWFINCVRVLIGTWGKATMPADTTTVAVTSESTNKFWSNRRFSWSWCERRDGGKKFSFESVSHLLRYHYRLSEIRILRWNQFYGLFDPVFVSFVHPYR